MIGLFIGSAAAIVLLLIGISSYWWTRQPLLGGVCGGLAGFCVGAIACETIGLLHWFAAIDVPNPMITIPGGVTHVADISPFVLAGIGAAGGAIVGAIRNKKKT
jgi:hypothetical protein